MTLDKIAEHFSSSTSVEVFIGFDAQGRGLTKTTIVSPLSFYHDSERHTRDQDDDPLQSYCPSCGIIQRVRQLPSMNKKEAQAALKWIRDTMATEFPGDNPEAEAEIEAALKEHEGKLNKIDSSDAEGSL